MYYGQKPTVVGYLDIELDEMMFYQYLPIKDKGAYVTNIPLQLDVPLVNKVTTLVSLDFINLKGVDEFRDHYMYLTIKQLYVSNTSELNRPGVHSDGFMTDDINYIWYNEVPTIFYEGLFIDTPLDDIESLVYFEKHKVNTTPVTYPNKSVIRLDQYNIHESNSIKDNSIVLRCFVKLSFSKDRYDLKGNAKNPIITKNWEYRDRVSGRNIPQLLM